MIENAKEADSEKLQAQQDAQLEPISEKEGDLLEKIDDNTIVGAGSVVPYSLSGGGVYVGNPARKVYGYSEWVEKEKNMMRQSPIFDESYKLGNIKKQKKDTMKKLLLSKHGYIV